MCINTAGESAGDEITQPYISVIKRDFWLKSPSRIMWFCQSASTFVKEKLKMWLNENRLRMRPLDGTRYLFLSIEQ